MVIVCAGLCMNDTSKVIHFPWSDILETTLLRTFPPLHNRTLKSFSNNLSKNIFNILCSSNCEGAEEFICRERFRISLKLFSWISSRKSGIKVFPSWQESDSFFSFFFTQLTTDRWFRKCLVNLRHQVDRYWNSHRQRQRFKTMCDS